MRWLIGTQIFWILLASLGEVSAFLMILGHVVLYEVHSFPPLYGGQTLSMTHRKLDTRRLCADTELSATHTSEASRRAGSTILRFRNIILRIGETLPSNKSRRDCDYYAHT
jgi:hypothetical protein